MFDIKSDRELLIKCAKSKGFTFPKVYKTPGGIDRDPKLLNLDDNWIWIEYGDKSNPRLAYNYLVSTPACIGYFKLNNSDVIEYIRNEKLKELLIKI